MLSILVDFLKMRPVGGSSRRVPKLFMSIPRSLAARTWIMALKPMSTAPEPTTSVTSEGLVVSRIAMSTPSSRSHPFSFATKRGVWYGLAYQLSKKVVLAVV